MALGARDALAQTLPEALEVVAGEKDAESVNRDAEGELLKDSVSEARADEEGAPDAARLVEVEALGVLDGLLAGEAEAEPHALAEMHAELLRPSGEGYVREAVGEK